jgi:hypothetical protein
LNYKGIVAKQVGDGNIELTYGCGNIRVQGNFDFAIHDFAEVVVNAGGLQQQSKHQEGEFDETHMIRGLN